MVCSRDIAGAIQSPVNLCPVAGLLIPISICNADGQAFAYSALLRLTAHRARVCCSWRSCAALGLDVAAARRRRRRCQTLSAPIAHRWIRALGAGNVKLAAACSHMGSEGVRRRAPHARVRWCARPLLRAAASQFGLSG